MTIFDPKRGSGASRPEIDHATALAWPAFDSLAPVTPDLAVLEQNAIVGFGGRDLRSRPFALLRSQVLRRFNSQQARLIGVTSATPAAGKSFVSLNLAAALARVSDAPVYLVDLDLRRGTVATGLGLECTQGISDVLSGEASLATVGRRIEGANLAVFPTRLLDEGSSELLAGDMFTRLVDGMRALPAETMVICDLPPVFAGDDAMITLEELDGYILVVDSGQTTARQVTQTLRLLEPTPCLGTILNRYRGSFGDSYAYSKSYDKDPYKS